MHMDQWNKRKRTKINSHLDTTKGLKMYSEEKAFSINGVGKAGQIYEKNQTESLSYQFSHSVVSNYLRVHELQHARPPCPSPTPGAYSKSCPLSLWCQPTISSYVGRFSSCPQSFLASVSFPMNQVFASGGQSIGVSALASVLPMNIQGWFPLGLTGWISLQSKGLSTVFSNTTVQKHRFFSAQLYL